MHWLNKIRNLTEDYRQHFEIDELEYIEKYDEYVSLLIENNTLEEQRHKRWDPFNVRYGKNSVKGFCREVCGLVIWNENHKETKMRLRADGQDEQRSGVDAVMTNPKWANDYVVQIKTMYRDNTKGKKLFRLYQESLAYDPDIVNRIMFVDSAKMQLYHFDYQEFFNHVNKAKQFSGFCADAIYIEDKFYHLKHFDSFVLNP